jgi:hypothetical protein
MTEQMPGELICEYTLPVDRGDRIANGEGPLNTPAQNGPLSSSAREGHGRGHRSCPWARFPVDKRRRSRDRCGRQQRPRGWCHVAARLR